MNGSAPLKLAIIAGEESGDLLGADLVDAIRRRAGRPVELIGVGGHHLAGMGMKSLFDPGIIAIGGITAVLRDLPRLVRLIGSTARKIAEARPDCVITIDSPAFNLRLARGIRRIDPRVPIVKYVCPSVWAWLPGRAKKMTASFDHVLCLLPFEPAVLARLGGPPGTFVGHRLTTDPGIAEARRQQESGSAADRPALLVLPGSRRSEVRSLIQPFVGTVNCLAERGHDFEVLMPTIPRLEGYLRQSVSGMAITPEISSDESFKWRAFGRADAALAASGTVLLELALAGVPAVSCYKLDPLMKLAVPFITSWSAALPNLIADRLIVPEYYDALARPAYLARVIESVWKAGPGRQAMLEGYGKVRDALETDAPAGDRAAEIVLRLASRGR